MSITDFDCPALPDGWKRRVTSYSETNNSLLGKRKVTSYIFKESVFATKNELAKAFSKITKNDNGVDLSSFDWENGKWVKQHHKNKKTREQLSAQIIGKGITDITFTKPNARDAVKRALDTDMKPVTILSAENTKDSEVKEDCKRPEYIEYDFDYSRSEGINGTPIEQPVKKRQKQDYLMPKYGAKQVFHVKRLEEKVTGKVVESSGKVLEKPKMTDEMDKKIIGLVKESDSKEEVVFMEGVRMKIDQTSRGGPRDFSKLLSDDAIWQQMLFCLNSSGKEFPDKNYSGQKTADLLRIHKQPEIFIDPKEPFVEKFEITQEVITAQANKVKRIREQLAKLQSELSDLEYEKRTGISRSDVKNNVLVLD